MCGPSAWPLSGDSRCLSWERIGRHGHRIVACDRQLLGEGPGRQGLPSSTEAMLNSRALWRGMSVTDRRGRGPRQGQRRKRKRGGTGERALQPPCSLGRGASGASCRRSQRGPESLEGGSRGGDL
uniref:Uncharacterized protein n=1 Tax=Rousettus aegyptiacus TaxID=9407 RepID=A0A7J8F0I5_ROUAE|nr:hypothetical protein HJG63_012408 [Rousettus aegyptiacus]